MSTIIRKRGVVTASFPGKREFIAKVRECQELARQKYPNFTLADEDLPIVFFAKGQTAGWAKYRRSMGKTVYNLEFNIDAIQKHWDDMVGNTVPHEMAHTVDRFMHGRSNGHGPIWKRIAKSLGCTGERTHNYTVEKARKTKKFVYRATCGTVTDVGTKVHNRIQRGSVYTLQRTKGKLHAECFTGRVEVS